MSEIDKAQDDMRKQMARNHNEMPHRNEVERLRTAIKGWEGIAGSLQDTIDRLQTEIDDLKHKNDFLQADFNRLWELVGRAIQRLPWADIGMCCHLKAVLQALYGNWSALEGLAGEVEDEDRETADDWTWHGWRMDGAFDGIKNGSSHVLYVHNGMLVLSNFEPYDRQLLREFVEWGHPISPLYEFPPMCHVKRRRDELIKSIDIFLKERDES